MRISSQNLGLKIFFKFFFVPHLSDSILSRWQKIAKKFFCYSTKQIWCDNFHQFWL